MAPPTLEESLRDNPQLSLTDMEYLREWLTKQPHLPPIHDRQLVLFLHCNEYSLERTKVCMDKFFTMRTHAPELFGNRDPLRPENMHQTAHMSMGHLPKKDSNGYCVVGMGLKRADLTHFDHARALFMGTAMLEVFIRDHPTVSGYTFVLDAQHLEFAHIARTSVVTLNKLLTYIQEAAPIRMKAVHVIHIGPIVDKLMTIIKPFLGQELQKILYFHSGQMKEFYEALPRDMLPVEYGGTCGSMETYCQEMMDNVLASRDWLMKQEEQQVNEALRPGKAKSTGDVFGMEGSFKKLDID